MQPTVHTFLTPKQGESLEDCEDSIHPAPTASGGDGANAFAVSDGVTTSFFGGLWARMLTARFAESPAAVFDQEWPAWILPAQEQWQADMRERAFAETASFYTRNDVLIRRPAAATFVGLLLEPPAPDGSIPWKAIVLGDSCLFILGKDGPRSLALTKAAEFSNIVAAAESYAGNHPHLPQHYGTAPNGSELPLAEGDAVLIATDALSKWLLLRAEAGQPVWMTILELNAQAKFEALVGQARREVQHPLENDDVALVVISLGSPHERYRNAIFTPQPMPEPTLSAPPVVEPLQTDPPSTLAPADPQPPLAGETPEDGPPAEPSLQPQQPDPRVTPPAAPTAGIAPPPVASELPSSPP